MDGSSLSLSVGGFVCLSLSAYQTDFFLIKGVFLSSSLGLIYQTPSTLAQGAPTDAGLAQESGAVPEDTVGALEAARHAGSQ